MSRMNHDYHFGLVCLSLPAVYRGAVCGQSVDGINVPATVNARERRDGTCHMADASVVYGINGRNEALLTADV